MRFATSCAALVCLLSTTLAAADCLLENSNNDCIEPAPQAVIELFTAANRGDEALFMQRLAEVSDADDYRYNNQTLLDALISPSQALLVRDPEQPDGEDDYKPGITPLPEEAVSLRAAHQAMLPAKTRMLAAALQRGLDPAKAGWQSYPALHLATLYGDQAMLKILLAHGVDPNTPDQDTSQVTPLELLLANSDYRRQIDIDIDMRYPTILTRRQYTQNIMTLLKAGTNRPFLNTDRNRESTDRPEADSMIWDKLLSISEGPEVIRAMLATGTTPLSDREHLPLSQAALAGNLDAIEILKPLLPRIIPADDTDDQSVDSWLDAAMVAAYGKGAQYDKIYDALIVSGMPFDNQTGPYLSQSGQNSFGEFKLSNTISPQLLLAHLVDAGRSDRVKQLIQMGASLQAAEPDRLLKSAIRRKDQTMLRTLLALGASPVGRNPESLSPAVMSIRSGDAAIMTLTLGALDKTQREAMDSPYCELVVPANHGDKPLADKDALALAKQLQRMGFPAAKAGECLGPLISRQQFRVADYLLDRGAKPQARQEPGEENPLPFLPQAAAAAWGQADLLKKLANQGGDTASTYRKGTLLDYALSSDDLPTIRLASKLTGQQPAQACLEPPEIIRRLVYVRQVYESAIAAGVTPQQHCPGQPALALRLAAYALASRWDDNYSSFPLLGDSATRLTNALRQAREAGVNLNQPDEIFGLSLMQVAMKWQRQDMIDVLQQAGASLPAPSTKKAERPATDKLSRQLSGHYYLQNVMETGAELLLRPDGTYEYGLAYGALDQYSKGTWSVKGKKLRLLSNPQPAADAFHWVSATPGADDQPVSVSIEYQGRLPYNDIQLTIVTDQKQAFSQSQWQQGLGENDATTETVSIEIPGSVQALAVSSKQFNEGRWTIINKQPDGTPLAGLRSFRILLAPQRQELMPMDTELTIQGKVLVDDSYGRAWRYAKQ